MRLVGEDYDYWGEVTLIHDVSNAGKIYGGKVPNPFKQVLTLIRNETLREWPFIS